jgi:uncharacterized membrane protein
MADAPKNDRELSRGEFLTVMAHFYRAEVTRSLAWRERLDRTTNWAVGATAAFLGFGFSHPEFTHAFFLFGLAVIYMLLFVESRRYRFYDAYEYRVRLLHQNFIYDILAKGQLSEDFAPESQTFWRAELASDLRYPQYKMDLSYALGRRLYANYIYLFAILLAAWLLKIKIHPTPAFTWRQFAAQASVGLIPGWVVFLFIILFILHLLVLLRFGRKPRGGRDIISSGRRDERDTRGKS